MHSIAAAGMAVYSGARTIGPQLRARTVPRRSPLPATPLFDSVHFTVDELADGVFAVTHREGGGAIANAGIIALGGRTLVFDTFISHLAARDLRRAAEILTGTPIACVVNSHYHNDHVRGNQAFAPAEIICTAGTLELLKTEGAKELAWDRGAPDRYRQLLNELEAEPDVGAREKLRFWVDYERVIAESLDGLEVLLPSRTFENQLRLEGSRRRAELLSYGPGHTGSDAFVVLPDDGIGFLGDLLFVRCHPYIADGDPDALAESLGRIRGLSLATLVPGHGPVGEGADVDLLLDYLAALSDLATRHDPGGAPLGEPDIPERFEDWGYRQFFAGNAAFIRDWLARPREEPR